MAPRKTPTARRVVGYVRISRDRENETSTETQRAAIEAYCITRGWSLVKVITEPGRSAYKSSRGSRPGFREAMNLIGAGASVLSVVKSLNAAGVKITHRGLTTALQSPTLVGMVAMSDAAPTRRGGARVLDGAELVPGDWEPILDREVWERVCSVLAAPGRQTNTSNALRWPLVPIARCHCGSAMRHHLDKYRTKSGTHSLGRLLCLDQSCLNGIGYDAVEEALTAAVLDLLDGDAWASLRTATTTEDTTAALDARLSRLWEMVLAGTIEPEEYAEAKARWTAPPTTTAQQIELPDLDDVRAAWPTLAPADRLLVFRAVIKSLTIGATQRRGGRGVDLNRLSVEWAV
jgi:hypothetical protein